MGLLYTNQVMKIAIKKLTDTAKVPSYAHGTDAGVDLYFDGKDMMIGVGARVLLSTGVAVAIPRQYVGLIWDKSGIAVKQGLTVLGGVVDAGYRGEVMVCLLNTGNAPVVLTGGQKIAQMLIQPVVNPHIETVEGDLPAAEDDRGADGFGSTGLT